MSSKPRTKALQDSTQYVRLEKYVKETVGHFVNDNQILGWEVWNEPDNMTEPSYNDVEIPNSTKPSWESIYLGSKC
mgnify:CR=1 FL=1